MASTVASEAPAGMFAHIPHPRNCDVIAAAASNGRRLPGETAKSSGRSELIAAVMDRTADRPGDGRSAGSMMLLCPALVAHESINLKIEGPRPPPIMSLSMIL